MSCAAWAEPPVIRTSPPDIITTLSAPSTAAVLARHDRLCVVRYLLFIDATPDIPSAPVWSRHGPPRRRAGRKEGKARVDGAQGASPRISGWPPSLAPQASAHTTPTV